MSSVAADMFPVRVLVETVRHQHCLGCAHDGNPLVDTFAVIGGQTMLCQLVETVLAALGLPQLVQDSKGLIQINGWKAISFETITDNPEELVSNLFREISTHITLKILAKRSPSEPNGLCLAELKQRLLKTAIEKQPQILTTANGQEVKEILQQVIQGDQQCSTWSNREQTEAVNEWLEQMTTQHKDNSRKSPLCITRFSPISELPRLQRWFHSDPNPSRQKLHSYMNILNVSPYRRANNKVTYQQICNWFINQRRTAPRNNNGNNNNKKQQQQQGDNNGTNSSQTYTKQQHQQPMAMLPLNATGNQLLSSTSSSSSGQQLSNHLLAPAAALFSPLSSTSSGNHLALLNSFAASLANASMDPSQFQQKLATLFAAGAGEECRQSIMCAEQQQQQQQNHQIPLAHGPPLDIRAKFDATTRIDRQEQNHIGTSGNRNGVVSTTQPDGNPVVGGQHSDRMDGGSESPTGNDDMSEQSGTDGVRDSMACSPSDQIFMDTQQQQQQQHSRYQSDESATSQQHQQQQHQLLNPVNESGQQQQSNAGYCLPPLPSSTTPQLQQAPVAPVTPVGLNLSHFLQPMVAHQPATPPPPATPTSTFSSGQSAAMAAAAAAAAFSSLMPNSAAAQSQLQFINQLAMASQFQQNMSPPTPQPSNKNSFGVVLSNGPVKSSPSTNSLTDVINREEAMFSVKSEGGGFSPPSQGANSSNNGVGQNGANGQQQSRSRLMFDPLSELPILEGWFEDNPHPGWLQIEQYTDYLNSMTYRQNYPPISTHNVKIWFKNRRAKTKRLQNNNEGPIVAAGSLGS